MDCCCTNQRVPGTGRPKQDYACTYRNRWFTRPADLMQSADNTQDLLRVRSLTRLLAEYLESRLKDHLSTVTPLFRARNVLGQYVQGTKEALKAPERALKELQELYAASGGAKPFYLNDELRAP